MPCDARDHYKNWLVNGAQGRIRTTDTRIFSPLLYQLSYLGSEGRTPPKPLKALGRRLYKREYRPCPAHLTSSGSPLHPLIVLRDKARVIGISHFFGGQAILACEPARKIEV